MIPAQFRIQLNSLCQNLAVPIDVSSSFSSSQFSDGNTAAIAPTSLSRSIFWKISESVAQIMQTSSDPSFAGCDHTRSSASQASVATFDAAKLLTFLRSIAKCSKAFLLECGYIREHVRLVGGKRTLCIVNLSKVFQVTTACQRPRTILSWLC